MNEKPFKLEMPFSEALERLARVPKPSVDYTKRKPKNAPSLRKPKGGAHNQKTD